MVQKPLHRISQRKAGSAKKTENILVFYQKLPLYNPQFEQGKPYKKIAGNRGNSTNYGKFTVPAAARRTACAIPEMC